MQLELLQSAPMPRPLTWVDNTVSEDAKAVRRLSSRSDTSSDDGGTDSSLAPLTYLNNITPPRRHPIDQETLMLFSVAGRL